MVKKSEPSSSTRVVKWSDEEWEAIARQLYAAQGPSLLESQTLEEVKAKDVFLAQETVLPPERHRKLISIHQRFEDVREKLKAIFDKAAAALHKKDRNDGASTKAKGAPRTRHKADKVHVDVAPTMPAVAHVASSNASDTGDTGRQNGVAPGPAPSRQQKNKRATQPGGAAEAVPVKETEPVSASSKPLPVSIPADTTGARLAQTQRREHAQGTANTSVNSARSMAQAPAFGSNELIEAMRPIAAMVCQELVDALLRAASAPANRDVLASIVQQALANRGVEESPGAGRHHLQAPASASSGPVGAFDSAATRTRHVQRHTDRVDHEEDVEADNDVQPLFDPKLPPSATSTFKPTVGVVGASLHDFSELQQMYPQLTLTAVAVDDVPHSATLAQCQRVIGLRDDVPAKTDELLRRTFRNRYLRLNGGMARVREQLDTWLNKPSTMQPRRDKFSKARTNKGHAENPKKRFGNRT